MGVVAYHYPGHLQHVRRAGKHHCIVEVADNTETGSARHEHVSYRSHPSSTRRRWRQKLQPDLVPPARTVERLLKLEAHLEEALHVGGGLDLQTLERSHHPRAGHFIAREAPRHVEYVLPYRILPTSARNASFLEYSALQEQLLPSAVAPVG